jgi:hypothetical protein
MTNPLPVVSPDVLAGMLALTLNHAMQRLHNVHTLHADGVWSKWTTCTVSTLCGEAAALYHAPETQLALIAAQDATGGAS